MSAFLKIKSIFVLLLVSVAAFAGEPETVPKIKYINLKECSMPTAARVLSELGGITVVATQKTNETPINLIIRDLESLEALKLICKSAGLVYRYDDNSDVYTVMTLKEYRENVIVEGRFRTKVFRVDPANLPLISRTIETLYDAQVELYEEEEVVDFSEDLSGGSASGGSNSNRGFNQSGDSRDRNRNNNNNNRMNDGRYGTTQNNRLERELTEEAVFAIEQSRTSDGDLSAEGERSIQSITKRQRGPSVFIATNVEHNMIVVRTSDKLVLDEIITLIDQMDQPVPQVILEMKILELDVSEGSDIGFNYSFSGTEVESQPTKFDFTTGLATEGQAGLKSTAQVGNFATQAASTFVYQYLSEDFTARVQMLAENSNVDVIATPLLIAANNRAARIEVGEERVLTVGASSDTNVAGNNGAVSQFINIETERRTIGTTLSIIPRINQDKTVTLYVEQESSTLLAGNNSITVGSTNVPIDSVDTANISATVVAKDRYTIAVGGLIRSERSVSRQKVPLLGDIPLAGQFFRQDSEALRKSELILLIRPYIIDDSALADQRTKDLVEELSDHDYHANGHDSIDENNALLERYVKQRDKDAQKKEALNL